MRTVELFSGCGGMSLGFQNAKFEIVAAYEYWDTAIECYKKNFTHVVRKMDLSDTEQAIHLIRSDRPDIIIGGPPCQDFSSAGRRVECKRASLTKSYAEIIDAIRPRFFVMENVDRSSKSEAYKEARKIFKNAGYGLTEQVLNASLCGVPQNRKRFICIGVLGAEDDSVREYLMKELSEKPLTLREYFGNSLDFEFYYRHPRNYSRRAVFSIDEPAPTIRGVNRPVPKGYVGNPNDACGLSENVHALTTLERSLIQTFPHTFQWVGSRTDTEQMIGNAVPVKLAEYVANAVREYAGDIRTEHCILDRDGFMKWLITDKEYTKKTSSNVLSRLRRADSISRMEAPDDHYIFDLEHINEFIILTSPVKSQIRRAVHLYDEYLNTGFGTEYGKV